ncbi:hypothetical protein SO802_013522 [Lithocarpus litseifolius]|uniref:Lariat debranching enzyme C-terminal domain-containing protein n=1 Tax=Lithocarpus litseifolius TaxID=425828 RepID=A0AAW2DBC2_9ROSI
MKSVEDEDEDEEVCPIARLDPDALWYHGGWAAPNIHFLGFAGVVKFGNIRIGGLSGIYNQRHYHLGHYERPPYNEHTIRSVYHVREYDVHQFLQVEEPIDIFLSHDWPVCITDYGNSEELIRRKPYFKKEIEERTLGSVAAAQLLEKLKPPYWFSAHLHCKFSALVQHGEGGPVTKFLALDKCLPGRPFLQILEIESEPGPYEIQYDEEWLAITRSFNSVFPLTGKKTNFGSVDLRVEDSRQWLKSRLQERGAKPFEFVRTVPCYNPSQSVSNHSFSGICSHTSVVKAGKFISVTTMMQKETVLEEFFHLRLEFYEKRKKFLLNKREMELLKLENKVRFILAVVKGEIIVSNRKRADLFVELQTKGFTPFPKKTKVVEPEVAGATDDTEETEVELSNSLKYFSEVSATFSNNLSMMRIRKFQIILPLVTNLMKEII